jgi:hypothetical protein
MTEQQSSVRIPLTKGSNYSRVSAPKANVLEIPSSGTTKHQAELQVSHYQRIGNSWDVLGAEFDAQKKMHDAHSKMFGAATAHVNAATAYVGAKTAWNKNQVAVANERMSSNEARVAIASVPLEIQRQNVELEKKREALLKSKSELAQLMLIGSQLTEDLSHERMLARLEGYKIPMELPGTIGQNLSGLNS